MKTKRSPKESVDKARVIRTDVRVATAIRKTEERLGLPEGCVAIVRPNGKKARHDKKIGSVLREYDK